MIVRLMGEGQYELDKKHVDEVNRIVAPSSAVSGPAMMPI